MKKVIFLTTLLSFLLHSCTKEEKDIKEDTEDKITLTLSENALEFASIVGTQIITVTANIIWEVISETNWLEVEINGSMENGSIMISVQRNFLTEERNATVFITTTSGDIVKEITKGILG